jgi:hypothetical protein
MTEFVLGTDAVAGSLGSTGHGTGLVEAGAMAFVEEPSALVMTTIFRLVFGSPLA